MNDYLFKHMINTRVFVLAIGLGTMIMLWLVAPVASAQSDIIGNNLVCPAIARMCDDGSVAKRVPGTCQTYCPNEGGGFIPGGGQQCNFMQRICADGSNARPIAGTCNQYCAGDTVNSFATCEAAGNPVGESYPRICWHNGKVYYEDLASTPSAPPSGVNVNNLFDGFNPNFSVSNVSSKEDRIKALQARIQQLMQLIERLRGFGGVSTAITPASGTKPWCSYAWRRALREGDSGEDVLVLQRFLNNQGIRIAASGPGSPGNESTFFGPATAQALAKFQEQHASDILTPVGESRGSGYFGTMTQQHLRRLCGGTDTQTDVVLRASPMSGAAPLTVDFTARGIKGHTHVVLNFGDGERTGKLAVKDGKIEAEHTYTKKGSYQAYLEPYVPCLHDSVEMACEIAVRPLDTAMITVGVNYSGSGPNPGTGAGNGMLPLDVTTDGLTVTAEFGVGAGSCGGYKIEWGDGEVDEVVAPAGDVCPEIWLQASVDHEYEAAGTYTIKLTTQAGSATKKVILP